jgi:hypothetical protein
MKIGDPKGSLVTSSLIRETTENESANAGYKFGQEEETYNIVAAHGYFGRVRPDLRESLTLNIRRESLGRSRHTGP